MRRDLAERLLAQIMGWTDAEKAEERRALEAFAAYKYDEYQQFAPGRRFLESLALWLRQFESPKERQTAYNFVRKRLIFISDAEMDHLVELAFPFFVRPHLIDEAAKEESVAPHRVKHILKTRTYRTLLRQTLILGLSDGARTDRFRRANPMDVSNEQIWHAYDISDAKAEELLQKLKKDLSILYEEEPSKEALLFRTVVLLDDFTASGRSYLLEDTAGDWEGKIARIVRKLESNEGLGSLVAEEAVKVIIIIYVAAPQAIRHIQDRINKLPFRKGKIEFQVVHRLSTETQLDLQNDDGILRIANKDTYFDPKADDEHGAKGQSSMRVGFANCRLPVVLSHNTPNNSIFLLWAGVEHKVRGLFPRVSRHRKFE